MSYELTNLSTNNFNYLCNARLDFKQEIQPGLFCIVGIALIFLILHCTNRKKVLYFKLLHVYFNLK